MSQEFPTVSLDNTHTHTHKDRHTETPHKHSVTPVHACTHTADTPHTVAVCYGRLPYNTAIFLF